MRSDAIALASPSGRMSKQARRAAEGQMCLRLFGKKDITVRDVMGEREPDAPDVAARKKVAQLREFARMASKSQAKKLLAEASKLEASILGA